MPGIVGLFTSRPRQEAEPELVRMVEALRHESFYETGTLVDERLGVYVGWIARKGSFGGGMPIWNERGDTALVFSGEEYPEPGTTRRLNERGHSFESDGPSYLVHLFEDDPHFPVGLNGLFHGLAIDSRRGTATLFNDRYGLHRLYYHQARDGLYFAAEAKAILAVRPDLRTVDPQGIGELVACRCVLGNRTLFKDIAVLPPAAAWVFQHDTVERRTYFEPREWENQQCLDPNAAYGELREIFSRNLPRYFGDAGQVGMSLTGGLDTRMIMAWRNVVDGSLPCYTFGGMFRDCQDVLVARDVAGACGQSHAVIPVGSEFLRRFPHYAERTVFLTDGCADVSLAPDLYVNEQAAEIAPVRMTGNYGGEVLRRVPVIKPVEPAPRLYTQEFLSHIRTATDSCARVLQGHPLSSAVFQQIPWRLSGLRALEHTQVSLRSPYLDNDLVRALFQAPAALLSSNELSLRMIADGNPALRRIRTDRGEGGDQGSVLGSLSRAVLELTFKAEYVYDYGMPQWLARFDHRVSRLQLERLFIGRHKFKHFRIWYRDTLSGYVRDILLDPRTLGRPYLQRQTLEAMVRDHIAGARNYTSDIHTVLTLELFHRAFVDSPPVTRPTVRP